MIDTDRVRLDSVQIEATVTAPDGTTQTFKFAYVGDARSEFVFATDPHFETIYADVFAMNRLTGLTDVKIELANVRVGEPS